MSEPCVQVGSRHGEQSWPQGYCWEQLNEGAARPAPSPGSGRRASTHRLLPGAGQQPAPLPPPLTPAALTPSSGQAGSGKA